MRTDIITTPRGLESIKAALGALPGAVWVPSEFRPENLHLEFPNGGQLWLSVGSVGVSSALPDAEHNAWSAEVFDTICRVVDGDVELLDEDDNVVKSQHRATA